MVASSWGGTDRPGPATAGQGDTAMK